MTPEYYRNSVLRSESPDYHGVNDRILHAVLGIVTEAGELADVIKKEAFYGRKPDKWKLLEELGDCRWYEELLCDELDVTMEEVKEMNIKKLKERYPDQFDDVEVRDYEAEQRAAEVGAIGVVSPGVKDSEEDYWVCGNCKTHNHTSIHSCPACLPLRVEKEHPKFEYCSDMLKFTAATGKPTDKELIEIAKAINEEPVCYAKKGTFGRSFGMFVLCKSSVIDKDLPCPYYKACNKKHELISKIDQGCLEEEDFWTCGSCGYINPTSAQGCLKCLPSKSPTPECIGQLNQVPGCSKCDHRMSCFCLWDSQFEDRDAIPVDQENTDVPDCFGKASQDDRTGQKCLGCLSRGPCVRKTDHSPLAKEPVEEERPVPECFKDYRTCSIYCTTVCGARTLCKAETPE